MNAIECNELRKNYNKKEVLKGINLQIATGKILGLLGKNGVGKTTLNRILTGLSFPSSGDVKILGESPKCGNGKINYLSENISIYPTLTAEENIAQIYLINNIKPDKNRIKNILDMVSIEQSKKKSNKFSLGMKRRLQIAMSVLVIERDIFILDEPTNGLDINGVLWLKGLLIQLEKECKTVIITSHAVKELEDVFTDYAILSEGKIKIAGGMNDIKGSNIFVTFDKAIINIVTNMFNQNNIEYELTDNRFKILNKDIGFFKDILKILSDNNISPVDFSIQKKSLVDLFIQNTGDSYD